LRDRDLSLCRWDEAQLYWATLGYLRWWWATDGARLEVVRSAGKISVPMLRSIALEYNVTRLILGAKKSEVVREAGDGLGDDPSAACLCTILNAARASWPGTLPERAKACLDIVDKAKRQGVAKKDLASATTKFMWFLQPSDWTVFDRFAKDGLSFKAPTKARDQMLAFYDTLEARGFVPLAREMQQQIDSSAFRGLPATRILDTLLMARGGRGNDDASTAMLCGFLSVLPEATREAAIVLATTLQRDFGHDVLKPDDRKTAA